MDKGKNKIDKAGQYVGVGIVLAIGLLVISIIIALIVLLWRFILGA